MAEVAAAAGVSRATLYRYLPSREALLAALAAEALADAERRIADAGLDRCPVPEGIRQLGLEEAAASDRRALRRRGPLAVGLPELGEPLVVLLGVDLAAREALAEDAVRRIAAGAWAASP
jgi:AcrR family transcriptional regulator